MDENYHLHRRHEIFDDLVSLYKEEHPLYQRTEDSGSFLYIHKFPECYIADDTSGLRTVQIGDT